MRLYLKISPASQLLPWEYQQKLVGTFHKWLGKNMLHDGLSLYSLSRLSGGKGRNEAGISFQHGATWFISSPDLELLKKIISGIQADPRIAFGMVVNEVIIQETPHFPGIAKFKVASPILIKRKVGKRTIHYNFDDEKADAFLTETLKSKLRKAGLENEEITVAFDRSYHKAQSKIAKYNGIKNKVNFCPVILKGSSRAIGFAWDVGVGNSTGIGFGALS